MTQPNPTREITGRLTAEVQSIIEDALLAQGVTFRDWMSTRQFLEVEREQIGDEIHCPNTGQLVGRLLPEVYATIQRAADGMNREEWSSIWEQTWQPHPLWVRVTPSFLASQIDENPAALIVYLSDELLHREKSRYRRRMANNQMLWIRSEWRLAWLRSKRDLYTALSQEDPATLKRLALRLIRFAAINGVKQMPIPFLEPRALASLEAREQLESLLTNWLVLHDANPVVFNRMYVREPSGVSRAITAETHSAFANEAEVAFAELAEDMRKLSVELYGDGVAAWEAANKLIAAENEAFQKSMQARRERNAGGMVNGNLATIEAPKTSFLAMVQRAAQAQAAAKSKE